MYSLRLFLLPRGRERERHGPLHTCRALTQASGENAGFVLFSPQVPCLATRWSPQEALRPQVPGSDLHTGCGTLGKLLPLFEAAFSWHFMWWRISISSLPGTVSHIQEILKRSNPFLTTVGKAENMVLSRRTLSSSFSLEKQDLWKG